MTQTAPAAPPPSTTPTLAELLIQPSSDASSPDATDGASDDPYCALCRRCQLRKKLERRLAARRAQIATEPSSPSRTPVSPTTTPAATREDCDKRSIDELLTFIGDGPCGAQRPDARIGERRRAARRRRRNSTSSSPGVTCTASSVPHHTPSPPPPLPTTAPVPRTTPSHLDRTGAEHDTALQAVGAASAPPSPTGGSDSGTDVEMSPEEEEAIDREVEAFRKLLESAYVHRGTRLRVTTAAFP